MVEIVTIILGIIAFILGWHFGGRRFIGGLFTGSNAKQPQREREEIEQEMEEEKEKVDTMNPDEKVDKFMEMVRKFDKEEKRK